MSSCCHTTCGYVFLFSLQLASSGEIHQSFYQQEAKSESACVLESLSCAVLHTIAHDARALLLALPHESHFRGPLVAHLLRYLPAEVAAEIASIAPSTVYHARSDFGPNDIGDLGKQTLSVLHQRTSKLLEQVVADWLKDECKTKSGSGKEHYTQWLTSDKLYEKMSCEFRDLQIRMFALVLADPHLVDDDPSLQTLLNHNGEALAFFDAVRSVPSLSATFGSVTLPGPAQLVVDYLSDFLLASPPSRTLFDAIKSTLPLSRPRKHTGQFDCSVCATGKDNQKQLAHLHSLGDLNADQNKQLKKLKRKVERYNFHQLVLPSQNAAFASLKHLPPGVALMLADFSTYDLQPNVNDSLKSPLSTLVLCIQREGHRRLYIDVLCQDATTQRRDSLYVRAGFLDVFAGQSKLALSERLQSIIVGTDTCAAQFRSRFVLPQFAGLKQLLGLQFRLLLHAEHHGHNLCDAHVAKARDAIKEYLLEQQGVREHSAEPSASSLSPIHDALALQQVLRRHFQTGKHSTDYECVVLPTVDRSPKLKPQARKIDGIMKLHDIVFDSATQITAKQLSSDAAGDVLQLRFEVPWTFEHGWLFV